MHPTPLPLDMAYPQTCPAEGQTQSLPANVNQIERIYIERDKDSKEWSGKEQTTIILSDFILHDHSVSMFATFVYVFCASECVCVCVCARASTHV